MNYKYFTGRRRNIGKFIEIVFTENSVQVNTTMLNIVC